MLTYYLPLLITLILFIIEKVYSQTCFNYTCASIDNGLCVKTITDSLKGEDIHLLQECPHYSKCPFDEKSSIISCKEYTPQNLQSYPGGKCEKDKDCITNKCSDNICQGTEAGGKCGKNSECYFGLACISGTCTAQVSKGLPCNSESECINNLACHKGRCTEFFTLIDGTILEEKENPFLCRSGYTYKNECMTLKNSDENLLGCDTSFPCNYTIADGSSVAIPNSCECIYSQYKQTHCMIGNFNNTNFDIYIDSIKGAINNYELCNAEENRPFYCREYLKNNWDIKKLVIDIKKQEIMALKAHRLILNDYCTSKVALGLDDTPPQPRDGKWKCPKYKCKGEEFEKSACAFSRNPFNEFGDNIVIALNENACKSGEKCNIQNSVLTSNWTASHFCTKTNRPQNTRKKFPGEYCKSHEDCQKSNNSEFVGLCIDGLCSGLNEEERCKSHADCLVGTFCNGLYCEKQKKERQFCLDQFHCLNHLGCLNNTCVSLNSQKVGAYLYEDTDERLCQFNMLNKKTGICNKNSYYNMIPDNNGFVKCNIGQMCNYTNALLDKQEYANIIQTPCECGFNEDAQGYCELSHDYRKTFYNVLY